MFPTTFEFVILALATWRIASLICNEDGPFDVFERIRNHAKSLSTRSKLCRTFGLEELFHCEWCMSMYLGAVLTILFYLVPLPTLYASLPFTLSTVTIVIKYVVQVLMNAESYLKSKQTADTTMQNYSRHTWTDFLPKNRNTE